MSRGATCMLCVAYGCALYDRYLMLRKDALGCDEAGRWMELMVTSENAVYGGGLRKALQSFESFTKAPTPTRREKRGRSGTQAGAGSGSGAASGGAGNGGAGNSGAGNSGAGNSGAENGGGTDDAATRLGLSRTKLLPRFMRAVHQTKRLPPARPPTSDSGSSTRKKGMGRGK